MKPYAFLLAGAALLTAGAAQAQMHGHHDGVMIKAADGDGDGAVTEDEFLDLLEENFEWMDRNGDDLINMDDRSPVMQRLADIREESGEEPRWKGRHGGMDANEDGAVSWEETREKALERFGEVDADDNGSVSAEELEAAKPERRHGRRGGR